LPTTPSISPSTSPRPGDSSRHSIQTQNAKFGLGTFDDRKDFDEGHPQTDHRLAIRLYGDLRQAVRLTGPKAGQTCNTLRMLGFMQRLGAGCFLTVQEVDGAGVQQQNVTRIRSLIVDADSKEQLRNLQAFAQRSGLWPSILVRSGGRTAEGCHKVQVYWLIRNCPVSAFAETQVMLLQRTGTDDAIKDLARVFRLLGCWHLKDRDHPRQTRVRRISNRVYDLADFTAACRAQPIVPEARFQRDVQMVDAPSPGWPRGAGSRASAWRPGGPREALGRALPPAGASPVTAARAIASESSCGTAAA
jgi:hypothetical protein